MRIAIIAAASLAPLAAFAWEPLDGEGIAAALTDRTFVYENGARQKFHASGRTLYDAGRESWGFWEVLDDLYCSRWPPADGVACYRVEAEGARIRFIGEGGDVTVGGPE